LITEGTGLIKEGAGGQAGLQSEGCDSQDVTIGLSFIELAFIELALVQLVISSF